MKHLFKKSFTHVSQIIITQKQQIQNSKTLIVPLPLGEKSYSFCSLYCPGFPGAASEQNPGPSLALLWYRSYWNWPKKKQKKKKKHRIPNDMTWIILFFFFVFLKLSRKPNRRDLEEANKPTWRNYRRGCRPSKRNREFVNACKSMWLEIGVQGSSAGFLVWWSRASERN